MSRLARVSTSCGDLAEEEFGGRGSGLSVYRGLGCCWVERPGGGQDVSRPLAHADSRVTHLGSRARKSHSRMLQEASQAQLPMGSPNGRTPRACCTGGEVVDSKVPGPQSIGDKLIDDLLVLAKLGGNSRMSMSSGQRI